MDTILHRTFFKSPTDRPPARKLPPASNNNNDQECLMALLKAYYMRTGLGLLAEDGEKDSSFPPPHQQAASDIAAENRDSWYIS